MRSWVQILGLIAVNACCSVQLASAQLTQFPNPPTAIRNIHPQGTIPAATSAPVMVPLNPAVQQGLYPSTGPNSSTFDPYSSRPSYQNPPAYAYPSTAPSATYNPQSYGQPGGMIGNPAPTYAPASPYSTPVYPGAVAPTATYGGTASPPYGFPGGVAPYSASPYSSTPYPNALNPGYPGMGQSGSIGAYNGGLAPVYPPGAIPGSTPPSLFPTPVWPQGTGMFGSTNPYGAPGYGGTMNPYGQWNPQGSMIGAVPGSQQFIRCYQGPRFRHTWLYGNDDPDALMINDTDVSVAFAIPNFLFSTQPLYLLPSFSLHQWDGPKGTAADLPSKAYSAFLDMGWQADPLRIVGAEVGVRVGVFSDFDTYTDDSLRVMGRALARVRLTPNATLKGGIIYLDRNEIEYLPALGILWQPNPATRFDIFFPEPKLAHYLSTVGTMDTWWYLTGNYGGGSWTVKRTNGSSDSIDINDIRVMLGVEWGRNDQLRDGRRVGFFEVGYVFNRELIYKSTPADNLDLQDTFLLRAGIGY